MSGDRQTREAAGCFHFTKNKFLLFFTSITLHFALKQRDGNGRSVNACAYLFDLHSLSLGVIVPLSETSRPSSFTLASNLAFPARMWSVMVRSDNSQLCSRNASIMSTCSWFDKASESPRKSRPRRRKR